MADLGLGFIAALPAPPIATDYRWNWVNMNHGTGFVPRWTGIKGGPAWFLDWGAAPTPPTTTTKLWDGSTWHPATEAQTWDGSSWWPLVGAQAWNGSEWVPV